MSEPRFMSVAKMKVEKRKPPIRCWIAGQRATGKTIQLAYAANAGYKVYLHDLNGENYHACLDVLTEEGEKNFFPISIYSVFNEKGKQEKGNKSQIAQLRESLDHLNSEGLLNDPKVIVAIDSISDIGRSLMNVNEAYTGTGAVDKRVSVLDSYNAFNQEYEYWLVATKHCNLVIIGHLVVEENNFRFDFISKSYGASIMNLPGVSNLFVCDRKMGKEKTKYFVETAPSMKFPFVKNSAFEKLEKEEPAEGFLAKFLEIAHAD